MAHPGITSGIPDFVIWKCSVYDRGAFSGPAVLLSLSHPDIDVKC